MDRHQDWLLLAPDAHTRRRRCATSTANVVSQEVHATSLVNVRNGLIWSLEPKVDFGSEGRVRDFGMQSFDSRRRPQSDGERMCLLKLAVIRMSTPVNDKFLGGAVRRPGEP